MMSDRDREKLDGIASVKSGTGSVSFPELAELVEAVAGMNARLIRLEADVYGEWREEAEQHQFERYTGYTELKVRPE